ncbi:hypothetical protein IPS36_20835 [Xanthomonas perforans]|uniref:DUF3990 domain-containing protein n=1 Tax=Xanthomonas perforans TaxID=442694 RepID=A0A6P0G668_XANPE|nr:hypothetical protein [Xanthomonas perforans]MBZ2436460.1 hypothetical protein [Xanthomonas perforans]MBZ2439383.1 hypothetical protein [Xanthomonas perforans]MBZ2444389.1 hypothetical protein [Xanthomonas perforans]MBZ2465663.1 hypothetical protein [Xanthomonas perforans]
MYKRHASFVLGFHGCTKDIGEQVIIGSSSMKSSANDYDWLGPGIYFWENSPERASQFASEAVDKDPKTTKGVIKDPFVVGAVIDLGLCFNLLDSGALAELKAAHEFLDKALLASGAKPPRNLSGPDRRARFLDCAVIKTMQELRVQQGLPAYDTVRGAFWEGGELYPGAGFSEKGHVQIAVVNPKSILGYFKPIK